MKIVNRQTFLALPAGTLFAPYVPHRFGDLQIKGASIGRDFLTQSLTELAVDGEADRVDHLEAAIQDGRSLAFALDCEGREGSFDDLALFAVWEPADLLGLITRLHQALTDSTSPGGG